MDETTNLQRATRAAAALQAYAREMGDTGPLLLVADAETVVADLLSDLQHFCAHANVDFREAITRGVERFNEKCAWNGGSA